MTNLYFSLAIYFALAVAIGFGLWLYLTLRSEIADLRKLVGGPDAPRSAIAAGIDASKRKRILSLGSRGEKPESIAATLAVPRNEVELTLKLAKLFQA